MTGYGLRRSCMVVVLLVIISMAAVLLLVANIGYVTDKQGEGILGPAGNLIAARIAEILFIVWIVLFAYFMILNFGMRKGGKRDVEPRGGFSWGWPIALLILIVFIVVVKLISGDPGAVNPDGGDGGGGMGEIIPGSGGGGPDSYIILIVTLAIIGIIAYIIVKEIWSRRLSPQVAAQGDEVREMIDQAVDSLEAGDDPRLVVYDCYLRMCILLERKGMTDISYMTPGEFASAAVGEFQLPRDRVEELTQLFEEARYSDHPVREGMRNRSIRCLNHIRKSLERGRVESGPEC